MSTDKKAHVALEMLVDDLHGDKERTVHKFLGHSGAEDFLYGLVRLLGSDNPRYVTICRNVREQPGHLLFFLLDNRQTALTKNVVLNIREQQIIIMSCNNLKLVLYVDVLYKINKYNTSFKNILICVKMIKITI